MPRTSAQLPLALLWVKQSGALQQKHRFQACLTRS